MALHDVDMDARDLPPGWHLKALLVTAALLGLCYLLATKTFLS